MSQFECSVKELNGEKPTETSSETQKKSKESILSKGNNYTDLNTDLNTDINSSLFSKLTDEKNVRTILLIVITYLITSSQQFTDLLGNSFPYLVESGATNLTGKIVVAIIIGICVILFTSFFQAP